MKFFKQVGLPAKSGVSGIILVVVPNVVGFATFSPNLDTIGKKVDILVICSRSQRRDID
jgi:glutaminase